MPTSDGRSIRLGETETEYLLYVPISQKDRAKGIAGRSWDRDRRCWVYPKLIQVYEALISEFGDDLGISRGSLAGRKSPEVAARIPLEDAQVRSELGATTRALEEARAALAERETQLEEAKRSLRAANQELELLRAIRPNSGDETLWDAAKAAAKKTARQSRAFSAVIDELGPDGTFPLEIQKALERVIRRKLGVQDSRTPLYDLLVLARQAEALPDEALDLAHTIRRQRNMAAHESIDLQTRQGRILLVLFAAAVLWPYLHPE